MPGETVDFIQDCIPSELKGKCITIILRKKILFSVYRALLKNKIKNRITYDHYVKYGGDAAKKSMLSSRQYSIAVRFVAFGDIDEEQHSKVRHDREQIISH